MACEGGLVTQASPRTAPRETGHSLEIHVTVDPADDSLADLLGWEGGVPGTRVLVLRNGTAHWDTLLTDLSGRVSVLGSAPVPHRVYAERFLTAGEREIVGRPRVFGDGRTVPVGGATAVSLRVYADRAGGLVISEIGSSTAPPWETNGSYFSGMYFEIFNNGYQTLYLDGVLFGATNNAYTFSRPTPCSMTEETRRDSLGIHTREILAFPGTGVDYPVAPGEARVVAVQAIDHRPVHEQLLDLSDAAFEIGVAGAANNPDAPDMLDVGREPFLSQRLLGTSLYFLATPQDPSVLPVSFRDGNGRDYVRIARETLIDVVFLRHLWPERDAESPECHPLISPALLRYEGGFHEIGFEVDSYYNGVRGHQRRALRRAPDGRVILFDTNTSAVDFTYDILTPGWVPEPPEN